MNIKKESGFTLLETLVSINLSFISIIIVLTFYLFITKFISFSSNNIHNNQSDNISLNIIRDILYKSPLFNLIFAEDSVYLRINKRVIVLTEKQVSVDEIFLIEDITLETYNVSLANGKNIFWQKALNREPSFEGNIEFLSNEIDNFSFIFEKNDKKLCLNYIKPPVSVNNFMDIKQNNEN